jgi:hypothetical protein
VPVRSAYACAVLVEAQAAAVGLLPPFWAWAKQGQRAVVIMLAVGALVHIRIQYNTYTYTLGHRSMHGRDYVLLLG